MLFALLNRPVPPGTAMLDPLKHAVAVQDVHHRHDGRVSDGAVVPQPFPDLAHHARALGGPHHIHDGHLKFTELAHLPPPPCIHVSTECSLSGVPEPGRGEESHPSDMGLFAPAAELPPPRPARLQPAGPAPTGRPGPNP